MTQIFKQLDIIDNFEQLKTEVLNIVKNISADQIMCQGLQTSPSDWLTGAGRINELEHNQERDYCVINPALNGTILEEYIKKYNGFRTRIMVMPGRHCYSIHPDPTPRIHIPIVTSKQAWMIWPYNNQCYQLQTGHAYWTDTRKYHTFINGADVTRIHLVMCVNN